MAESALLLRSNDRNSVRRAFCECMLMCVCVCGVCVYGSICSYLVLHPLLGTDDVSGDVIVFSQCYA